MSGMTLVDLLPARLWAPGNLYLVFGRHVHLCVGDGARTVEVDGREVARGAKPVGGDHGVAGGRVWERLSTVDLGWTAAVVLAATLLVVIAVRASSCCERADSLRRR